MPFHQQRKAGMMQVLIQGAFDAVGFVPAPNGPAAVGLCRYTLDGRRRQRWAVR
jgi:hypothetical protein